MKKPMPKALKYTLTIIATLLVIWLLGYAIFVFVNV